MARPNNAHFPWAYDEFVGVFTVYYLPEEHYVGVSKNLYDAYHRHIRRGKKVKGIKPLSFHKTKEEARHRENLWHSWLGCNGMKVHG